MNILEEICRGDWLSGEDDFPEHLCTHEATEKDIYYIYAARGEETLWGWANSNCSKYVYHKYRDIHGASARVIWVTEEGWRAIRHLESSHS